MIKIKIKSKKLTEENQSSNSLALFKIPGAWFSAESGEASPKQENLLLVNSAIFIEFIKQNEEEIKKLSSNSLKTKKELKPKNILGCKIANDIINNNGILALASYDSAEALGHGPCSGAMELIRLAGRGYGEKMFRYSMAAIYPRPLTIDRESVSGGLESGMIKGAQGLVAKLDKDTKIKKVPQNYLKYVPSDSEIKNTKKLGNKFGGSLDVFDDKDDPITSPKEDDCLITYYANKAMNRGFIDNSSAGEMNKLLSAGNTLTTQIDSMFSQLPDYKQIFQRMLRILAQNYFRLVYSGYLPQCEDT